MSSGSTDPRGPGGFAPGPSFGRTFVLALLFSRILPVLAVALLGLGYVFRDGLGTFFDRASASFMEASTVAYALFPAAVLGFLFGWYVFYRHIFRGVIVVVEPVEGNASCFRMSGARFASSVPPGVPFTPFSTTTGEPYYIVKGFDGDGKLIPGDVHSRDEDFVRLMAYRDRFNVWLADYHRSVDRSVELELVPFGEGQEFARAVLRRALDFENMRRGMSSAGRKVSEDPQNLTEENPGKSSVQEGSDGRR